MLCRAGRWKAEGTGRILQAGDLHSLQQGGAGKGGDLERGGAPVGFCSVNTA